MSAIDEARQKELAELDYAVAKIEHPRCRLTHEVGFESMFWACRVHNRFGPGILYRPTSDRDEGLRLLEKYGLCVHPWPNVHPIPAPVLWHTYDPTDGSVEGEGQTPCEAICRCVVALAARSKP